MDFALSVPLQLTIEVRVHEIEGGGFWAEVPSLPGCLAQAETMAELRANLSQTVGDRLSESPEKTEAEARQLAAIQGSRVLPDATYPRPYGYVEPASWSEGRDA